MECQGKIPVTEHNVTLVALLDLDSVGGVTAKVGGRGPATAEGISRGEEVLHRACPGTSRPEQVGRLHWPSQRRTRDLLRQESDYKNCGVRVSLPATAVNPIHTDSLRELQWRTCSLIWIGKVWAWWVVGGGGRYIRDSRTYLKCRLFLDSHVERVTENIVESDRWRNKT